MREYRMARLSAQGQQVGWTTVRAHDLPTAFAMARIEWPHALAITCLGSVAL